MPERTSYDQGTPSWIDLSTTDPAGSQEFYGSLFGWEFVANPIPDGGEYIMAMKNGKAAAALMQQSEEQAAMGLPSLWNTYITVDDIQAATGLVEGAGGSVMMAPMDVMDAGRMAVVVDPTGAVVCLWQPQQNIGAEVVNEHGALVWNELITSDVGAAVPFYKTVLGVDSVEQDIGMPDPYTMFTVNGEPIAGAMPPPMEGIPNHWSVYIAVDDTDAAVATAESNGGTILAPPMDIPPGRMAVIQDPQGATLSIMSIADQSG